MKMKKACEATALTERAIRLYLSKNLIVPRQIDGIIDFSNEDIQHLKDIAILRQFDFSIEQIASMIHDGGTISDILQLRLDNAKADIEHENEVCAVLSKLDGDNFDSLHSIAAQIRKYLIVTPEPNFGRFDEIEDEIRRKERMAAFRNLSRRDKREGTMQKMLGVVCIIAVILVFIILFLSYPRIGGYIKVTPLSIMKVNADRTVTVCIEDEWAIDAIGRDTITVPYQIFGRDIQVGDRFEMGCQLAVELTNFDLLRIGINPLQDFRTKNVGINNEWMKLVIRSMFDNSLNNKAMLWINEISNLRPLIVWK